jgi:hypothetical protein
MREVRKRVFPNGVCWCGCGEEVPTTAFFVSGHDRRAESNVIKIMYGSVPQFLDAHGFGPGGRNANQEGEALRRGKTHV